MAKETDWSQLENKVKLSLLQAEKRLVDLELGVAELREMKAKLQDFDPSLLQNLQNVEELQQRVADLEDLTMVESMGVGEVMQVMEEIREKVQAQPAEVQQAPVETPQETTTPLPAETQAPVSGGEEQETAIAVLDELKARMSVLAEAQKQIDTLKTEIATLKVSANSSPVQRDRVEGVAKDVELVNVRINTLESVVRQVSEKFDKFSSTLERVSTYEKATTITDNIEKKMQEFQSIEAEVRRLSGKIEGVYENIDSRLEKIRNIEKKYPELNDTIEKLQKSIDENRILVLGRVKREDIEELKKSIEDVSTTVQAVKASTANVGEAFAKTKSMEKTVSDLSARMQALQARHANMETLMSKFDKDDASLQIDRLVNEKFNGLRKDLESRAMEAKDVVSVINFQMSDMANRIIALESRLAAIEKLAQETLEDRPMILE